jgi:hypothetical protein
VLVITANTVASTIKKTAVKEHMKAAREKIMQYTMVLLNILGWSLGQRNTQMTKVNLIRHIKLSFRPTDAH